MQSESATAARGWLALSIAAAWMAGLSKEVAVAAPLLVLLWDRTFDAGSFTLALRRRGWLYAGLATSWAVPLWVLATGQRGASVGGGFEVSPVQYLCTQSEVLLWYLRLSFFPAGLTISYEWPIVRELAAGADTFATVAALFALTVVAVARWPAAGFAGAWFFLLLGPTSSVLPIVTEVAAERRMYLPLAAVLALAVTGGHALLRRVPSLAARRGIGVAIASVAVVAAAVLSVVRLQDYATVESIWRDALAKRPGNAVAHTALALELGRQERMDEAERHLRAATAARPDYLEAPYRLGLLQLSRGEVGEAVTLLRRAVDLAPRRADFRSALGGALLRAGDARGAAEHLAEAAALAPTDAAAHAALGEAFLRAGRPDLAVAPLQRAVELGDPSAGTRANLGVALLATHRPADAAEHLAEATRLDPSHLQAHYNLALALEGLGRWEEAIAVGERAQELAQAAGDAAMAERIAGQQDRRRRAIAP